MEQHRRVGLSVNRVAHNRHAQPVGGMHPDLVGAAGFGDEADHCAAFVFGDHFPCRHRALALLCIDHDPPTRFCAAHLVERQVDHARPRIGHAIDDRQIMFYHSLCLKRLLETGMGLGIAGEKQAAAGIAVEPVDGCWPAFEAEHQCLEMVFKAQGAVARRVNRQAGRLVNDDGLTIEEKDVIDQHGAGHRR